ncbi:MAG: transketolase [Opitutales bacterium]
MTEAIPEVPRQKVHALRAMADQLRHDSLISTSEAGSGHPTSCMSCAELVSALFFHVLRYDLKNPKSPHNDRFVLSKGHAAPVLWAVLAEAGAFPREKLKTLRQFDSDLEGHPTPRNPFVDVATGSLGQGLSVGAGMARSSKMDEISNRVYVLLGDGETAEGAVWEAAAIASHYRLDNLTAILDVNRLGQSEETMYGHDVRNYENRLQAFGWKTRIIDGHDMEDVLSAYAAAQAHRGSPFAIIARTIKGKGVGFLENVNGQHGKPVPKEKLQAALEEIGTPDLGEELKVTPPEVPAGKPDEKKAGRMAPPDYKADEEVPTRKAYGYALKKLGDVNDSVVALDGEVKNSTYAQEFANAFPGRYTECYIAEQNMVGMAIGMSALGKIPFVSTFACFLTRACDQIRMAGISRANVKFCGSHVGVSIGEDGPSQMGLEDLALFRAVPGSTVLYPADGFAAERCVELAAKQEGIVYIRTARPGTPLLYSADYQFKTGGSGLLKSSPEDAATVVAAGITTHEALKAAKKLEKEGVPVRVIDLYSVKPIDEEAVRQALRDTGVLVTVEDHYAEGGLGDAVLEVVKGMQCSFQKLAVRGIPRSGDSARLLGAFGIDAESIVEALKEAFAKKRRAV